MRMNDDDITTSSSTEPEGPADAGAVMPATPNEHDGGADGGASGGSEMEPDEGAEGPMDAGAGEPRDPHVTDGGADGGA